MIEAKSPFLRKRYPMKSPETAAGRIFQKPHPESASQWARPNIALESIRKNTAAGPSLKLPPVR